MLQINFAKGWSRPYSFVSGKDDLEVINGWSCSGKSGIYMISNQNDKEVLYVEQGDSNHTRLKAHLKGYD